MPEVVFFSIDQIHYHHYKVDDSLGEWEELEEVGSSPGVIPRNVPSNPNR